MNVCWMTWSESWAVTGNFGAMLSCQSFPETVLPLKHSQPVLFEMPLRHLSCSNCTCVHELTTFRSQLNIGIEGIKCLNVGNWIEPPGLNSFSLTRFTQHMLVYLLGYSRIFTDRNRYSAFGLFRMSIFG